MTTPAQVANDMSHHATYWHGRDKGVAGTCRGTATLMQKLLRGEGVDTRTFEAVRHDLLAKARSHPLQNARGYPNFARARETLDYLRRHPGVASQPTKSAGPLSPDAVAFGLAFLSEGHSHLSFGPGRYPMEITPRGERALHELVLAGYARAARPDERALGENLFLATHKDPSLRELLDRGAVEMRGYDRGWIAFQPKRPDE